MYQPTTRVLTVLELLQSRPNITGPELAACLEVDVRTIRRYITMLQDLGIPVEAEIGRHGGYRLKPGFKLPPLMFSEDEALAVTLGLQMARGMGLAEAAPAVEGALAKIERVLPVTLRERVGAVQQTMVMSQNRSDVTVPGGVISTLSYAVQKARQVRFLYQPKDAGEAQRRTVDPYGVVGHGGRWYLAGYCHFREDLRVFRLDRIKQLELLESTFAPPEKFDSLGFVLNSFAEIPDRWDVEVLLQTSLEEAQAKITPGLAKLEPHPEGVWMWTSINDLDWLARFLVGLGCQIRVIKPVELGLAFERLALELARIAQQAEALLLQV